VCFAPPGAEHQESFEYDDFGQVATTRHFMPFRTLSGLVGGQAFTTKYEYDEHGRLETRDMVLYSTHPVRIPWATG
jgi:hypothetical protein